MEPWLRDAVIVFIILVLLFAGVGSFIACWQRSHSSNARRDD
jgi:hypothetical protein